MRKDFSAWTEKYAHSHQEFIFLTGDLGFQALENVHAAMSSRFVNMGVSEQNMVSVGAGLAQQGLSVICYSIAPFAVFRPCEQIRLDVCLHNKNVKIVGNGGGYGYGIMGATHHAIEDLAMMSSFQNMVCYIPFCNEDVGPICDQMMTRSGPGYLRLGFAVKPDWVKLDLPITPIRHLIKGKDVTVVSAGPVTVNALEAVRTSGVSADVFVISEFPLSALGQDLLSSIQKTRKILVVEEHVSRGGLAEMLSLLMMKTGVWAKLSHLCAQGYPDHLYGSQKYHQTVSRLDSISIAKELHELTATRV